MRKEHNSNKTEFIQQPSSLPTVKIPYIFAIIMAPIPVRNLQPGTPIEKRPKCLWSPTSHAIIALRNASHARAPADSVTGASQYNEFAKDPGHKDFLQTTRAGDDVM